MTLDQNDLGIIVYAPALVGDDGRPLAIVHGMERALPGLRLEWTTSEEGRPHRIAAARRVARGRQDRRRVSVPLQR